MPVYGSTTGVGAMKDVEWSPEDLDTFNLGLVRAHHFGTGSPFSMSVVRNAMAISQQPITVRNTLKIFGILRRDIHSLPYCVLLRELRRTTTEPSS